MYCLSLPFSSVLTVFLALRLATQIQLSNVPRTATPADLRRLISRAQVQGVEHSMVSSFLWPQGHPLIPTPSVALDYHRLEPNGRAYLELTHPDYLSPNLDALEKVTISGVHLVAEPSNRVPDFENEQLNGDGLSSELGSNGKNVVVWGLPKGAGPGMLDQLMDGFSFPPGEPYIFKMPPCVPPFLFL